MALKAVLFDLDGTLIKFQIDYLKARAVTIAVLERHGYPVGEFSDKMLILAMLEKAQAYFRTNPAHHYDKDQIIALRKEVGRQVEVIEADAAKFATPLPGIHEVLQFTLEQNLKLAIITFNTTANAMLSLKTAGLLEYFPDLELIVGRDQVEKAKPHAEHGLEVLKRLDLSASEVCIVGDHPNDIQTAVNIGARSIAVISDKHSPDEFNTQYWLKHAEIGKKMLELLNQFINN